MKSNTLSLCCQESTVDNNTPQLDRSLRQTSDDKFRNQDCGRWVIFCFCSFWGSQSTLPFCDQPSQTQCLASASILIYQAGKTHIGFKTFPNQVRGHIRFANYQSG